MKYIVNIALESFTQQLHHAFISPAFHYIVTSSIVFHSTDWCHTLAWKIFFISIACHLKRVCVRNINKMLHVNKNEQILTKWTTAVFAKWQFSFFEALLSLLMAENPEYVCGRDSIKLMRNVTRQCYCDAGNNNNNNNNKLICLKWWRVLTN